MQDAYEFDAFVDKAIENYIRPNGKTARPVASSGLVRPRRGFEATRVAALSIFCSIRLAAAGLLFEMKSQISNRSSSAVGVRKS